MSTQSPKEIEESPDLSEEDEAALDAIWDNAYRVQDVRESVRDQVGGLLQQEWDAYP